MRQDPSEAGVPLSRIAPHALMQPPGIPDFFTRDRVLAMGPCRLTGRVWSGGAADRRRRGLGRRWRDLGGRDARRRGPRAVGVAVVGVRLDAVGAGRARPRRAAPARTEADAADRPAWNLGGYANPAPQRIVVTVRG